MSYKFIGEVERGTGNPTVGSVDQIATALGLDIADLLQPEDTAAPYPPIQAADVAVVRDVRNSLAPLEEMMRRLTAAMKPNSRRRQRKP